MLICSFYCLHASQLPPTHTDTSKTCVCVGVEGRPFYCHSSWAAKPASASPLTLFAPTSLIVKCMQTVSEYSSHCCCCCCYSRDWCCSGCRYFCASDGNTFINFTAGHWQRQQAPPVASCQSHSHYVWTFFSQGSGLPGLFFFVSYCVAAAAADITAH